jgi:two-component system phosphate regulon response regulator PhoB
MARILWVEDEDDIRTLLTIHLKREGHHLIEASSGSDALKLIQSEKFDLAILDWMLPDINGLELVQKIRAHKAIYAVPILMLTARSEATDIVRALDQGADDYLTKPFSQMVLLARVRALLRRNEMKKNIRSTSVLELGPIRLNLDSYQAYIDHKAVHLTKSEFKLLQTLIESTGKVLTRQQLIRSIQGEGVTVVDRAIDTQVFGLRKKLTPHDDYIETIRGIGYRIRSPE